ASGKAKSARLLMEGPIALVVEFGEIDPPHNKIAAKNRDILRQRQTADEMKKGRPKACLAFPKLRFSSLLRRSSFFDLFRRLLLVLFRGLRGLGRISRVGYRIGSNRRQRHCGKQDGDQGSN